MFNLNRALTFNRNLVPTKRDGFSMCKLSKNYNSITKTIYGKKSKNVTVLIEHHMANAICEPTNKNIKLNGSRVFECRPKKLKIMERIPGPNWETKSITVGCEVFIFN